jgi:hypothetical protein
MTTAWSVARRRNVAALCPVLVLAAALVVAGSISAGWAQTAPAQAQAPGRVFASDAGMIINTIKADKTADFEMVVGKIKEALQKSENGDRKAQAASWRVFRVLEPGPNNSVLYVFWFDPPVKGADYTVSKILNEGFPAEVQALYKTFNDSYSGGQSLLNLQLVSAMGK